MTKKIINDSMYVNASGIQMLTTKVLQDEHISGYTLILPLNTLSRQMTSTTFQNATISNKQSPL